MWTCVNCRQGIEDQFDACWQCGCSREGKMNLEFSKEPEPPIDDSSWEGSFAQHFKCAKCQEREARVERVAGKGTGFEKLLVKDFLAVSCENCGFTELYNLSVLEGRSNLGNFLRGLFGT